MLRTMPATEDDLSRRLDELGIATTTHRHAPVFTVAEAKARRGELPGGHCKSLFLRDKKGAMWLVVTGEDTAIDLKALQPLLGSKRLSFGSAERLERVLGVSPGSVTPFAVINETAADVRVVLEKALLGEAVLNFHPLDNSATTAIPPAGLLAFLRACGHEAAILALR
jgi:Ala-tRNA(Pro) deacylase